MSTALAGFSPYVSLWVAQTQAVTDLELMLELHQQGQWGEVSPEQQGTNQRNWVRQRGQVVSVFYSARHHRLRFTSDFATKQTLVRLDESIATGDH
jgi:hypothetical protein